VKMRVYRATLAAVASLPLAYGFTLSPKSIYQHKLLHQQILHSSVSLQENESVEPSASKKKKLGLLTFDLDDTLYSIEPVLNEANTAFSKSMSDFGYVGIQPSDIVETGKKIRTSYSKDGSSDSLKPATVNHKEIRLAAIRKEMEQFILKTKLRQTAEDWATEIESLTSPVKNAAEQWARTTVHQSVVQAVYQSWEMERHHAAERHLFTDAISTIKDIKDEHPDVIIGAVTDGSANPMLMVFSLMPLFDFSVSWEDDLDKMKEQFQELSRVGGVDDLSWIYRLALEKGKEMSHLESRLTKDDKEDDDDFEWTWIHVGDDLAYDVGGSATMGAKTILAELDPNTYLQTARLRVEGKKPSWSTENDEELAAHKRMSKNAVDRVDARITHLHQLPEAIEELLK